MLLGIVHHKLNWKLLTFQCVSNDNWQKPEHSDKKTIKQTMTYPHKGTLCSH